MPANDLDDLVTRPDFILVHQMSIKTGETIEDLVEELDEYWDVLLGYKPFPSDKGVTTLMEYAHAVYARAMFVNYHILQLQREGAVEKNSPLYKFRTGELRAFIEAASKSIDTGSRLLTKAKMEQEMNHDGNG